MSQATYVIDKACAKSSRAKIVLDLSETATQAATAYFLRAYKGRADLSEVVLDASVPGSEASFEIKLEKVRTALYRGDHKAARGTLDTISAEALSSEQQGELGLETTRVHLWAGELDQGLEMAQVTLQLPHLPEATRMTLLQLTGHFLILKKDYERAVEALSKAAALFELFPNASSGFAAWAFLVQAYSILQRRSEALMALEILRQHASRLDSDELWVDRLLTTLRAEAHFHRAFQQNDESARALAEALQISRYLGDRQTEEKCRNELAEIGNAAPDLETAWKYFPRLKLLLSWSPKKATRLDDSPVTDQILTLLEQRPRPVEELFTEVWKLAYKPDQHYTHVQATLSKIRKLLPKGALFIKDQTVYLK